MDTPSKPTERNHYGVQCACGAKGWTTMATPEQAQQSFEHRGWSFEDTKPDNWTPDEKGGFINEAECPRCFRERQNEEAGR